MASTFPFSWEPVNDDLLLGRGQLKPIQEQANSLPESYFYIYRISTGQIGKLKLSTELKNDHPEVMEPDADGLLNIYTDSPSDSDRRDQ